MKQSESVYSFQILATKKAEVFDIKIVKEIKNRKVKFKNNGIDDLQ